MNKKYPEGYWVSKLTDDQIKELAIKLLSKNEKFSKIEKPQRNESDIIVKYHYEKTNAYWRSHDSTLTISDFDVNGKVHSSAKFYEFMINALGEEYAEQLVDYLEDKIQNMNQELNKVKSLAKFKANLKADLQNHETSL